MLKRVRVVLSNITQGVSLIVAPRGTGTTVAFNIPGRLAIFLGIVVAVLIVGLFFSGYTYSRLAALAVELTRLHQENAMLRSQTEKIRDMQAELTRIEKSRRQIEAWAGLTPEVDQLETGEIESEVLRLPTWPRRYTYSILRDAYLFRSTGLPGMSLPTAGWVSRGFIEETDEQAGHPGVDIVASTGTPVRSVLGGRVVFAGWDEVFGNVVIVEHNDSLSSVYGHNEELFVNEGDGVGKGQVIATVGTTGRSTAPHLHFGVLKNGIAVDPELYVDFGHIQSLGTKDGG